MKFIVRTLTLHRDIVLPGTISATDGTVRLYEYRSLVKPKDLEPPPAAHLAEGMTVTIIPAGLYLFTQGELKDEAGARNGDAGKDDAGTGMPSPAAEARFREAAEAVWLESLWRETPLKNERILVRTLSEDSKNIFQIFREV